MKQLLLPYKFIACRLCSVQPHTVELSCCVLAFIVITIDTLEKYIHIEKYIHLGTSLRMSIVLGKFMDGESILSKVIRGV